MTGRAAPSDRLRVVIVGGGVGAVEALLALRELAPKEVDVVLLSEEPYFWYRPLAVVAPFGRGEVARLDLGVLAAGCDAEHEIVAVTRVDVDARRVTTATGAAYEYEALLVATGARPVATVADALCFRGPADVDAFERLLQEVERARDGDVAFVVPSGPTWPLPLYELAFQTAHELSDRGIDGVGISIVSHESLPLEVFGRGAGAAVAERLDASGIRFSARRPDAARLVTIPQLDAAPLAGIPTDADGFVETDANGRVTGVDAVYAAGDMTAFPVKQGGLAAQQASAAAHAIAVSAGAEAELAPLAPVLRAVLVTGAVPLYLEAEYVNGEFVTTAVDTEPLWWPPGKIVGRHLSSYLAARAVAAP